MVCDSSREGIATNTTNRYAIQAGKALIQTLRSGMRSCREGIGTNSANRYVIQAQKL
ncbi:hypothetical protein LQZ19_01825 [Treponema primitia]|uniref:hypothetical protein n=1 Tax=Treponema primitia TaxID=88058 RepID=UPI0039813ACE